MRYGSVCSGIEAATVAWHPLGWKSVFFSEIEKFPCQLLDHHYPDTPNLGDMTKFKEWPDAAIDVLVGGTPCQSFSVAGLRKGLDDPRGNLMLTFGAIASRYRPRWLVWENVPGVLSSNGGRDFGAFLGMLGELGYGFAYRVLDAQYFGVAQRRRRVFVVGYLGDWRRAAAVLFERHSLSGHPAPRREKREETADHVAIGIDEECNAGIEHFGPLLRGGQGGTRAAVMCSTVSPTVTNGPPFSRTGNERVECEALVVHGTQDPCTSGTTAFALGRNNGAENAVLCMSTGQAGAEIGVEIGTTLNCNHEAPIACYPINTQIATRCEAMGEGTGLGIAGNGEPAYTLQAAHSHAVGVGMQVRRLLPEECEKLQGFPRGYTKISDKTPDGVRYKALGNSMAVPVMRWIGERIKLIDGGF